MGPTTADRRSLLPTVTSAYGPVERFLDRYRPAGTVTVEPLDALVAHALLGLLPPRRAVVDLAAAATAGASTVLALTAPRVARVVCPEVPAGVADAAAEEAAEATLERGKSAGADAVVLLPATPDAAATARAVLGTGGVALVLGVGKVGSCPTLTALLDSGLRVWLTREYGESLSASGVAVLALPEAADQIASLIERFDRMFTTNYRFLNLARAVNDAALVDAHQERGDMPDHPLSDALSWYVADLKRQSDFLKDELARLRATWGPLVADREALLLIWGTQLHTLHESFAVRAALRFNRLRHRLMPPTSLTYRAFRAVRRAVQVLRSHGPLAMLAKAARKVLPRSH